jgi:hypothetical protein
LNSKVLQHAGNRYVVILLTTIFVRQVITTSVSKRAAGSQAAAGLAIGRENGFLCLTGEITIIHSFCCWHFRADCGIYSP